MHFLWVLWNRACFWYLSLKPTIHDSFSRTHNGLKIVLVPISCNVHLLFKYESQTCNNRLEIVCIVGICLISRSNLLIFRHCVELGPLHEIFIEGFHDFDDQLLVLLDVYVQVEDVQKLLHELRQRRWQISLVNRRKFLSHQEGVGHSDLGVVVCHFDEGLDAARDEGRKKFGHLQSVCVHVSVLLLVAY